MLKKNLAILSISALPILCPTLTIASVVNDEVTSEKLMEADGTSGQDTSTGSGVKTNHIQNGAVTAAKLGITCPNNQFLKYSTTNGWVCSAATAARQVIVAKNGGNYTSPMAAVNDLASWCYLPSESNACVIKVMPAAYDFGHANVTLPPFVSIIGSGQLETKFYNANFTLTDNNELADFTIQSVESGDGNIIGGTAATDGTLKNLTIVSDNSLAQTYGSSAAISIQADIHYLVENIDVKIINCSTDFTGLSIRGAENYVKLNNSTIDISTSPNTAPFLVGATIAAKQSHITNSRVSVPGSTSQGIAVGEAMYVEVVKPTVIMNTLIDASAPVANGFTSTLSPKCINTINERAGYSALPLNCEP